jgi:hypothetical protein
MTNRRQALKSVAAAVAAVALPAAPALAAPAAAIPKAENRSNTTLWYTQDDTPIRIVDLGDEHLLNCIRMLERRADEVLNEEAKAAEFWRGLGGGASSKTPNGTARGREMTWYYEGRADRVRVCGAAALWPEYVHLVAEARRRGLEWADVE